MISEGEIQQAKARALPSAEQAPVGADETASGAALTTRQAASLPLVLLHHGIVGKLLAG